MQRKMTEEELRHRRYLKRRIMIRKKRRQVYIARTIAVILLIILIFLIGFGGYHVFKKITGGSSANKKIEAVEPTSTPFHVNVPDGYEKEYESLMEMREEGVSVDEILMNLQQYPKEVLNLLIHNNETLGFVKNYPKHMGDVKETSGVTENEVMDGIPLFQQWDKRWGYVLYGNDMIAIDGCGPTCLSMVYSGLKQSTKMSPADVAEFSMQNNYYDSEAGTKWSLMKEGAEKIGLKVNTLQLSEKNIEESLRQGHPIICSMKPGDFTTEGHFIVLTGIDASGLIHVNDPNSKSRSEQSWEMDEIKKQIKAMWSYSL